MHTRLLQSVDDPYGPRLRRIIEQAEARQLLVVFLPRGIDLGIWLFRHHPPPTPPGVGHMIVFRAEGGRLHLLPRPTKENNMPIPVGQRYNELVAKTASLLKEGVAQADVEDQIRDMNRNLEHPLPARELNQLISSESARFTSGR